MRNGNRITKQKMTTLQTMVENQTHTLPCKTKQTNKKALYSLALVTYSEPERLTTGWVDHSRQSASEKSRHEAVTQVGRWEEELWPMMSIFNKQKETRWFPTCDIQPTTNKAWKWAVGQCREEGFCRIFKLRRVARLKPVWKTVPHNNWELSRAISEFKFKPLSWKACVNKVHET